MPKKAAPRPMKRRSSSLRICAPTGWQSRRSHRAALHEKATYYAFPDDQSYLNLEAARLRHIAGTAWSTKYYMNMRPLYRQLSETGAVGRNKSSKESGQYRTFDNRSDTDIVRVYEESFRANEPGHPHFGEMLAQIEKSRLTESTRGHLFVLREIDAKTELFTRAECASGHVFLTAFPWSRCARTA
ncbi:hypothetical protein [Bradyrhizobium sp. BRP22]|uniref:hypothetical protein n=1 Tax=Bradyrhizobium sp. BRP22 TaxID=2793821 RepID=UPI001CD309A3|nr:hypothetical protein [Bradyrhizobium sp. BRP22]